MKNFLSRREFLRAAGVSGAVVPLLEAGRVQAAAPPRRLIVVAWTNGFSMPDFWPRGGERDFTLGQTLSPLEPFRDNMLFVGGLAPRIQMDANPKFFGGHHTYPALLNAWPLDAYNGVGGRAGGESVDQFIARQIAKQQLLRFPSLVLSAQWAPSTGALASNISYATKGGGITPQLDPVRLYEKVFMGELLPPETLRQIVGEKRSILDFVGESLKRYSKRLSALDREKIESHNESLRVIERRLQTLASVPGCQPPTAPPVVTQGGEPDANRILNYPLLVKAQMDLAHTSLACDLSRVVTLILTDFGGDTLIYPWLGSQYLRGGSQAGRARREFHDITHTQGYSEQNRMEKIRVDQWYMEQIAYLAGLLKSTKEGSGTMLDNTAIVVTNTMASNHNSNNLSYIIIGGCGGYFKTGRFLKFGAAKGMDGPPPASRPGEPHNGLLVGLANAMGMDGSAYGPPGYTTELPGLRG